MRGISDLTDEEEVWVGGGCDRGGSWEWYGRDDTYPTKWNGRHVK